MARTVNSTRLSLTSLNVEGLNISTAETTLVLGEDYERMNPQITEMGNEDVERALRVTEEVSSRNENKNQTEESSQDAPKSAQTEERCKSETPTTARRSGYCAICLDDVRIRSHPDRCLHAFCFICLVEWSKERQICPLCRQRFNDIFYNLRSYQRFNVYHLKLSKMTDSVIRNLTSETVRLLQDIIPRQDEWDAFGEYVASKIRYYSNHVRPLVVDHLLRTLCDAEEIHEDSWIAFHSFPLARDEFSRFGKYVAFEIRNRTNQERSMVLQQFFKILNNADVGVY